ncbi:MAG: hypothetical protein GYB36_11500 [Alphaproteobacteria bacterium]|nr:hypothetical protein [Alphaproteobacteria bacterium]
MNEHLEGLARSNAFGAALVLVIRAIIVALGLILMAISVPIGILTPILPIGAMIGFVGLIMVAAASKTLHSYITKALKRFPWLWKRVRWAFGEKDEEASSSHPPQGRGNKRLTNTPTAEDRAAE